MPTDDLSDAPDTLSKLRRKVDQLDERLVHLLLLRFSYTDDIGRIKSRLGMSMFSEEREAAVIESVMEQIRNDAPALGVSSNDAAEDVSEIVHHIMRLVVERNSKWGAK